MITTEGMNYLINAGFKGGTQYSTWYVAPYKANYTPTAGDTAAATIPLLTESTAYVGASRPAVTLGTVAGGAVNNSAVVLEIESTADETWYGAMLISTNTKGQAAGVLIRVDDFPEPVVMTTGSKLQLSVNIDLLQPA